MLISDLIAEAARIFYITQEDITGPSRKKIFTKPRFALMKALHLRGWSIAKIGRQLAKDHTTIMHGLSRANILMETDKRFRLRVDYLADLDNGAELSPEAGPDTEEARRIEAVVRQRRLMLDVLDTSDIPDRAKDERKPWEHEMAPRGWGAERWVKIHYNDASVKECSRKMLERILATGKMWIPAAQRAA